MVQVVQQRMCQMQWTADAITHTAKAEGSNVYCLNVPLSALLSTAARAQQLREQWTGARCAELVGDCWR